MSATNFHEEEMSAEEISVAKRSKQSSYEVLKASGAESSDPSESAILMGIVKCIKNTDQIGSGGLTKNTELI